MNLRKRTWEIVELAKQGDTPSRAFDVIMLTLIFLNVIAVIVGTVQAVQEKCAFFLSIFEAVSVVIFTFEYIARFWSCTHDPRFRGRFLGRLRFMFQAMSIIDVLAILPFYLPFLSLDLRSLRTLRLLRVFRVVKAARYCSSLEIIRQVFVAKKEELAITSAILGLLMVVSATLLYYCENSIQPAVFSSIPATMWWAVTTLTTVGYGDMSPVTWLGKVFGGCIAIIGIGMFALPTGIIGAGFTEIIQKKQNSMRNCPHCGKEIC